MSGWGNRAELRECPRSHSRKTRFFAERIVKSFDVTRKTRSRFLEWFRDCFGCEVAIAVGEGLLSSFAVRDGFPS